MSLKPNKNVQTLVEKYRRDFPDLESRYLRRLIRSENKALFSIESQLKQLTRCLKKSYGQPVQRKSEQTGDPGRMQDLELLRLALKLADPGTPLIIRDVDLRVGKHRVTVVNKDPWED